jgi:hypothetical protein
MTLPDLEHFVALESAVWDALVAGDADADQALLADDFVGVYPDGFAGRLQHAETLAGGPTIAEYAIDSARLVPVSDSAALLCYAATYRRAGATEAERMYVSSLWCHRDGRWVNTFSQDTPVGAEVP